MELRLARKYLHALSKGIDPLTLEPLPDGDCCAQEEVRDALKTIYERLKLTNGELGFPMKHGESWTKEEDRTLIDMSDDGKSIDDICKALQRSAKSIRARLKKLGENSTKRLPLYTGMHLSNKNIEYEGREVSVLVEKRKDGTERIRYSPDNFK